MSTYRLLLLLLFFAVRMQIAAQTKETEFTKGFIAHLKLHNGMLTRFSNEPDLYVGGLQFIPQLTIVPGKIRAGVIAGAFYTTNKIDGQFGATASFKLKTLKAGIFGSIANIHLTTEHIWGTRGQRLAGAGFNFDFLNKIVIGISTHRDYALNGWWLQTGLGIRLSKVKKEKEPFN